MSSNELEIHIPTDEEEAEIQKQIAMDPDAPEWTDEDWARARPAIEVAPHLVERYRRARAQGKKIPMIEHVSIPMDAHPRPSPRKGRPQLENPRQRHTPQSPHQFMITSALKTAKIVHNCRIHYLLDSSAWRIACCQNRNFKIRN